MTNTENPPEAHAGATAPGLERRPAPSPSGLAGWVLTDDHKFALGSTFPEQRTQRVSYDASGPIGQV